jgi:hypothetical protein
MAGQPAQLPVHAQDAALCIDFDDSSACLFVAGGKSLERLEAPQIRRRSFLHVHRPSLIRKIQKILGVLMRQMLDCAGDAIDPVISKTALHKYSPGREKVPLPATKKVPRRHRFFRWGTLGERRYR